jgi:type II secretory pathway pseudopilin PulG
MKANRENQSDPRGVTLIELTVVIFVVISMMSATMYFAGNIGEWNMGKRAATALREVYAAQRSFLADHPRRDVDTLTEAELLSYLPSGAANLPVVEALDGTALDFNVSVSPPVLVSSGGSTYDPSGSADDSLWDVGK